MFKKVNNLNRFRIFFTYLLVKKQSVSILSLQNYHIKLTDKKYFSRAFYYTKYCISNINNIHFSLSINRIYKTLEM